MKDYIAALSSLALVGYVYLASEEFAVPEGKLARDPAYYPRALAIILTVLAISLLIKALTTKEKNSLGFNKELLINVGKVFSLIFVYILAFQYIGFIVSTMAFIIFGILLYGGSVKSALLCGVPVTIGVYVIFHTLMKVPMPHGILF